MAAAHLVENIPLAGAVPGKRGAVGGGSERSGRLDDRFNREATMRRDFSVVIERDEEGYYVASVPAIPGCHTQARSLDDLIDRIRECIALCLDSTDSFSVEAICI